MLSSKKVCAEETPMLNEERVKQMVKLASYESKEGAQEIKIDAQPKKKYIYKKIVGSLLWMTIAYLMFAVFVYEAFISLILTQITSREKIVVIGFLGLGYISLSVIYGIRARIYYKAKHAKAHSHVKQFEKELKLLEKMYEEEPTHE